MVELVNLRTARKQAKRRQNDQLANASRLEHGQRKHLRKLADAQQTTAIRDLDQHRVKPEDGQ